MYYRQNSYGRCLGPKITGDIVQSTILLKDGVKDNIRAEGLVGKLRDYQVVNEALDRLPTITAGARTERQCDPARLKGDDELLAALLDATSWRRERDVIVLIGVKTLRFRPATN